jgi:hypothetical protein
MFLDQFKVRVAPNRSHRCDPNDDQRDSVSIHESALSLSVCEIELARALVELLVFHPKLL